MAFADWNARRVKVTRAAIVAGELWGRFLREGPVSRPLTRHHPAPGGAAADAFASGDWASLGGWWMDSGPLDTSQCWWFKLEIHRADIAEWVDIKGDMQDDIAFFECLAQVVLASLRQVGPQGLLASWRWVPSPGGLRPPPRPVGVGA